MTNPLAAQDSAGDRIYPATLAYFNNNYGHCHAENFMTETESSILAFNIASALIQDKRIPEILRFTPIGPRKKIIPIALNTDLRWDYHDACRCDGLIFDLLFHKPLPLQ